MIDYHTLHKDYAVKRKSVREIAFQYGCSENKITYWLNKYNIRKRSISEAIYIKNNPNGDPFKFVQPSSSPEWFLYGLGLGLFWGEGNKVNKHSVRLGNTDPYLVRAFILFLKKVYTVDERKFRFGLQVFNDVNPIKAKKYWQNFLGMRANQFQKVVITKPLGRGTYKKKSEYGVLTIYFSNTKLRDSIMSAITELRRV